PPRPRRRHHSRRDGGRRSGCQCPATAGRREATGRNRAAARRVAAVGSAVGGAGLTKKGAAEAAPIFAVGDLQQLDGTRVPPAVSLPFGHVRLDVAGPPANLAVHVEDDELDPDITVSSFPISDA